MIGTRRGWPARAARAACATVAAVALAGAVAACGTSATGSAAGATGSAAGATGSAPSATNAAATAATATSASAPGAPRSPAAASAPSRITAPGTRLSVGRSARVAYTPAGAKGSGRSSTLLVTVRSIERGSLSDFNGIQLNASQKASTPYYVMVHVTNLGPHTINVDESAAAIEGVDTTGNNQQSVTFIGTFPRCPDAASTAPLGAGRGYDDCLTFLIPGGITKVSYNGTTGYIDSPVTWSSH